MNKTEIKEIKGYSIKIGIGVLALLLVGGVVSAFDLPGYMNVQTMNVETLNISGGELAGLDFGAITMDKSTFDHGIEILAEGLDITGGDLDVDVTSDFSADVAFSDDFSSTGTTTIPWLDASFQVALDFQRATTTYGGATEYELVVGTHQHTGSDLLCTDVWLDIYTACGIFAYDMRVGTSTTATSSAVAHLIDATTSGWEIGTTTIDILSKEDDEGTSATEVWDLNNGEYLAVTQIFVATGATSSDSLLATGGNATEGTLHVNCRNRY